MEERICNQILVVEKLTLMNSRVTEMYVLHYQNIFKQSHVKKTHKYPQGDFVWFSTKFSEVQL